MTKMSKHREAMAESIVDRRRGSSNSGHLFSAVLPPRSPPPLFNVALDSASARCTSQYNVCTLSKPCFLLLCRGQSRLFSGQKRRKIKREAALRVTVFHYPKQFKYHPCCESHKELGHLVTLSQRAFRDLYTVF